jgi:hypothetical protein
MWALQSSGANNTLGRIRVKPVELDALEAGASNEVSDFLS